MCCFNCAAESMLLFRASRAVYVYLVVWFTACNSKTIKPKRGFTDWRRPTESECQNHDTFMMRRNVICNYDVDEADGDAAEDDDKMCSTIK